MLHCVTCYFNPKNYFRFKNNYIEFRKRLKYPLTTVELAFNDQEFFIEDAIQIRGNDSHILWQKERLLNLAIESLPSKVDKIVWIDADLIFQNENWFNETEAALDEFPVVQPFEYVTEDGVGDGEPSPNKEGHGFAKGYVDQKEFDPKCWPKCGLTWAMRREAIPNGLYDKSIIGNGDALQLAAWMGQWDNYLINLMPPKTRKEYLLSKYEDYSVVESKIGYVKGVITHLYHGNAKNRRYFERNKILINNDFDSLEDIVLDDNGLYKLSSNKPRLYEDLKQYFSERRDDE